MDVDARVRGSGAGGIERKRAFSTCFRRCKQSAFALRERMLRGKPPVVAVMRREAIHEAEQLALVREPPTEAVEPEHAGRWRQHHCIAWKLGEMCKGCRQRSGRLALDRQGKCLDMLSFTAGR